MQALSDHIISYARTKDIYIDSLNGSENHLHCLLCLRSDQRLCDVIKILKGESSHWINQNTLIRGSFKWCVEYYAASVSGSHVATVRNYIKHQERHHMTKDLDEELRNF